MGCGYPDIVKLLVTEGGVDVSSYGSTGYTVLHLAAEKNHPDLLKLILETKNIEMNPEDEKKQTRIHRTAYYSRQTQYSSH